MALRPEVSIGTGLAVAGIVLAIHSQSTPSQADMKGLPAGNSDVDAAERKATWTSIGVVSAVSLLAKDPTVFVIGSGMTVAMAFLTRHAVWTDSASGMVSPGPGQSVPGTNANVSDVSPQMTATQAYTMYSGSSSEFVSS